LAIVTLLEIQLLELPVAPVVELSYHSVSNGVEQAIQIIEKATHHSANDYVDGIMFSKDKGVVCVGTIQSSFEKNPLRLQTFSHPGDPWFYIHAEEKVSAHRSVEKESPIRECIPLLDYLFRYDRGGFWVGKYAFQYFMFPQNKFMRWALDHISHTKVMYHAVHKSGLFQEYTIQDVAVPYSGAKELLDFVDQSFGKYPLWLCPVKQVTSNVSGLLAQPREFTPHAPDMMLSVGIWGPGPRGKETFIQFNRQLERLVHQLGGEKWLYARTYYTEEEFWSIYPLAWLEGLREKYNATYLPNLYQKVKVDRGVITSPKASARSHWRMRLAVWLWQRWPHEYLLEGDSQ
jgi:hypothetical protein